jgi:fatty acid desaturase
LLAGVTEKQFDNERSQMNKTGNVVRLHGELYQKFNSALRGRQLLRWTFLPQRWRVLTYVLWVLLSLILCLLVLGITLSKNSNWCFPASYFLILLFFIVAESALHRAIQDTFPDDPVLGNLDQQPWKLRRAISRYAFLYDSLREQGALPTQYEIDNLLRFIEANRADRPPAWTSFFRHPLVIATYGILIFLSNSQIQEFIQSGGWRAVSSVICLVVLVLYVFGMAYAFRYSGPNAEWKFECCIRWLRLQREEECDKPSLAIARNTES